MGSLSADNAESPHIIRAFRETSEADELQVFRDGSFRGNAELRKAMTELVRHRYEDPTALLDKEFARCDTVYLARSIDGPLLSFLMIGWETVQVSGQPLLTARAGLLATAAGWREEMSLVRVYQEMFLDVSRREAECGHPIPLWATTANPGMFLGFHLLVRDPQPYRDGTYNAAGEALARGLRPTFGLGADDEGHPFYLPGVMHATRYSPEESARIAAISKKKKFTVFRDLGIDESRGDRILIFGYPPTDAIVGGAGNP